MSQLVRLGFFHELQGDQAAAVLSALRQERADAEEHELCFWYILQVAEPDPQRVQDALRDVVEPEVLEGVMTAAEKLRLEGRVEGRVQGQAHTLLRQLRLLFGELGAEVEQRVRTADEVTLDTWTDRVLGATSLEDVFSPSKPAKPAKPTKGKKKPGSGRRKR